MTFSRVLINSLCLLFQIISRIIKSLKKHKNLGGNFVQTGPLDRLDGGEREKKLFPSLNYLP